MTASCSQQNVDGRCRAVIEAIKPQIDGGRFAVKRCIGESVSVEADVFTDGHDAVRCMLLYRSPAENGWRQTEMQPLGNDRWRGNFAVTALGCYRYTVAAWVDHFVTWRRELQRRESPADILLALRVGAQLLRAAAQRAEAVAQANEPRAGHEASHEKIVDASPRAQAATDAAYLTAEAQALTVIQDDVEGKVRALEAELEIRISRYPDRGFETVYDREFAVVVDPIRARFGSWYEFFPRSTSADPAVHGTFKDCEARLADIAAMGFDVLYLPPIHPIGRTFRKGRNNSLTAGPEDPGSPWAIGSAEGGHRAVHPELGTLDDFRSLVRHARQLQLEIALDIAFQSSPDHPYVKEHPEWFRTRPDGTVQYAENPPKKYQDIYPFDFETSAWEALHRELTEVVLYWIEQGVRIFRVDNPHTKPFTLWESMLATIKARHPEVIFLAEAFTRPKVMQRLAKVGFTQSYTYFAWRNTKWELTQYLTELTQTELREYFRPNLWANTPDILSEYLQLGGRPAFMIRAVLAATLAASYGIYGPAFELAENRPREPGSEEYLDSEKYQRTHWDLAAPQSLRDFLTRINRIRRDNPALQSDWSLKFIDIDSDQLLAYSRSSEDLVDAIVVIVNLDPYHAHSGWVQLPLGQLGLSVDRPYRMHDLLSGTSFLWHGARNFVSLDPEGVVAHVFRVRRHVRTERDFDYFM